MKHFLLTFFGASLVLGAVSVSITNTPTLQPTDQSAAFVISGAYTNGPANSNNVVRWMEVRFVGSTNIYWAPLYQ